MKKKLTYLFFVVTISLIILEILLRISGFKSWEASVRNKETIFEYNAQLGWISKKGKYSIPSQDNSKKNKFTIEQNGNRFSGKKIDNRYKKIVLIGGSFTQGAGVSDNETFAFQLQSLLPNHEVLNYGQAGYGTVQSFLMMNQVMNIEKTDIIIYGFIDHHLRRNVARGEWLETLLKSTNTGFSQKPSIPYGILNKNNNLKIMPKTSYLTLPLREKSALITVLEKIYMKQTTRHRKKIQLEVLLKSLNKMQEVAKKNNNKFIVVNLDLDKKKSDNYMIEMSKKNKINYLDCRTPNFQDYALKNEYHPNPTGHKFFSKCINKYLKNKLFL